MKSYLRSSYHHSSKIEQPYGFAYSLKWRQQWPIAVMIDLEPVVPGSMLATAVVPLNKELYSQLFQSAVRTVSVCCTDSLPDPSLMCCDSGDLPRGTFQTLGRNMRLNHKNRTDELCLTEVRNEFIQGSTHRETIFGKFLLTD